MTNHPRIVATSLVALLLVAGCGNSTPEPLGDEYVIETAREFDVLDPLSDQDLIKTAMTKCPVVDRYGTDGFDHISRNIDRSHDDPEVVVAMFTLFVAAIRAYCPEHFADLQEWSGVADFTG